MHVVIDPGHGGHDRGAKRKGLVEADITLAVSQLIAARLRADPRFEVTLTRTIDQALALEDRATFANRTGDVFLSIHVNSSPDSKARGKEIYFQNQLPANEESLFLASRENPNYKPERQVERLPSANVVSRPHLNADLKAIVEDLERHHRFQASAILAEKLHLAWQGDSESNRQPIRQAPFFVVSNIDKPSALIELGYVSHPKESLKLVDPEYQKKIAQGIYNALVSFKEIIDKPTDKSLN